jgi:hypothetical protein
MTLGGGCVTPTLLSARESFEVPVLRPIIHVGDVWRYRQYDGWSNRLVSEWRKQVTAVTDKIVLRVSNIQNPLEHGDAIFDLQWNSIVLEGVQRDPFIGDFQFPLNVGKTWNSKFRFVRPAGQLGSVECEQTSKVETVDTIDIDSLRYQCLRINVSGRWRWLPESISGPYQKTIWYAPAVRRWVKLIYTDRDSLGGLNTHERWEFVGLGS